ncbi:hypothetical protein ACFVU3_30710 [Streptomyces sp. NPDC058052]|uniref:hypothetical protein n=1 Tax=Streptomyces sp. NPDC058052 TaxID=3346316 RepID=UPI0036E4DD55
MGVFAMFRRKKKGTADGVAEVSPETAEAETGTTEESGATESTGADGPVTRVTVAGLTAPAGSAPEAAADEAAAGTAADGPDASGPDTPGPDAAVPVSGEEGAPEEAGAVAEVVEIPRQQSAGTASDAESETGETARR